MDELVKVSTKKKLNRSNLKQFFDPLIENAVMLFYPLYANTYVLKHHYGLALDKNQQTQWLHEFNWDENPNLFNQIKKGSEIIACFTCAEKYKALENFALSNNYDIDKVAYSEFFYRYIFLDKDPYVSQVYDKACELQGLDRNNLSYTSIYNHTRFIQPLFSKYISHLIKKGYKSIILDTDIPDEANSLLRKLFYEEYGLSYKLQKGSSSKSLKIYIKGGPQCSQTLFNDYDKYVCFSTENYKQWTSSTQIALIYHKNRVSKDKIDEIKKVLESYSNILFSTVKEEITHWNKDNPGFCLMNSNNYCNPNDRNLCKAWKNNGEYYCILEDDLFDDVNNISSLDRIIKLNDFNENSGTIEKEHFIRCLFNHNFYECRNENEIQVNSEVSKRFESLATNILNDVSLLMSDLSLINREQILKTIIWKELLEYKFELFEKYYINNNIEGINALLRKHYDAVREIDKKIKEFDKKIKASSKSKKLKDNKSLLNIIHFVLHFRYMAETYNIQYFDVGLSINSIEMLFLHEIPKQLIGAYQNN